MNISLNPCVLTIANIRLSFVYLSSIRLRNVLICFFSLFIASISASFPF